MNGEHMKSWAAGFIDGEGCFTVEAKRYKDGRQKDVYYRPRMSVQVRRDDERCLKRLQEAIGNDGYLYRRKSRKASTYGSTSKPTSECSWHTMAGTIALVNMLDIHPLLGKKAEEYKVWRDAVLIYTNTDMPSQERQQQLSPMRTILQQLKKYRDDGQE